MGTRMLLGMLLSFMAKQEQELHVPPLQANSCRLQKRSMNAMTKIAKDFANVLSGIVRLWIAVKRTPPARRAKHALSHVLVETLRATWDALRRLLSWPPHTSLACRAIVPLAWSFDF